MASGLQFAACWQTLLMVHTVKILAYTPRNAGNGRLQFELFGNVYNARCIADPELADGLFVEGKHYPVTLRVESQGKVEYSDDFQTSFDIVEADESGDTVRANGRTWQTIDHQEILLKADPSLAVTLNLPQTASDYRGGSWLTATGTLVADLPPEDHD